MIKINNHLQIDYVRWYYDVHFPLKFQTDITETERRLLQFIDKNILLPFLPAEHITDTFLCQQPSSPARPRLGERCRLIASTSTSYDIPSEKLELVPLDQSFELIQRLT